MASGRFVVVSRQEGMRRGQVRSSCLSKPSNGADNALVFLLVVHEGGILLIFIEFWTSIDRKTGPIRSCTGRNVAYMDVVRFNQVRCESGLTEMYLDNTRGDQPLEVGTEKPFYSAYIVNHQILLKKPLKLLFDCRVLQEIDKVIDIEAKCKGGRCG